MIFSIILQINIGTNGIPAIRPKNTFKQFEIFVLPIDLKPIAKGIPIINIKITKPGNKISSSHNKLYFLQ